MPKIGQTRNEQTTNHDHRAVLHHGDCLEVMRGMRADSIDSVVTDPPYALPGGFMGKGWDNFDGREDSGFGYWLAGFTDGEGCFRVQKHERGTHTCVFQIKLRRDDRAALERIQRFVGHGTVKDVNDDNPASNPQAVYVVQDKEGCDRLVSIFRRYPLTAKKAMDFEVWAEAVWEWLERPRGNRWVGMADQTRAAALKTRLENVRHYTDVPWSGHKFQDWCRVWAGEALRVAKPGAYLLAFGGTRTYHRLACAIEDAGWEIRDCVMWVYGSGFPKSLDVSKAIDKAAGAQREVVGSRGYTAPDIRGNSSNGRGISGPENEDRERLAVPITAPATPEAAQWDGWGTALKPAWEPIIVARKPLSGTVAQNVLLHGTGALNIDGCRVETDERLTGGGSMKAWRSLEGRTDIPKGTENVNNGMGRWPANLIHDGSEEVVELLGDAARFFKTCRFDETGDPASASRIIYCPKASKADRNSGLDGTLTVKYNIPKGVFSCRDEIMALVRSLEKATFGSGAKWHTDECGGSITGLCPLDSLSTTLTMTSRTTTSQILSLLTPSPTSASTQAANSATGNGGNLAGSAASSNTSIPTTTSENQAESALGARDVVSQMLSLVSDAANWTPAKNNHATVKPTELMKYLCRLVTPPGGVVLDPFMGSGSTGKAALLEGFRFVGIEQEEESYLTARKRVVG